MNASVDVALIICVVILMNVSLSAKRILIAMTIVVAMSKVNVVY